MEFNVNKETKTVLITKEFDAERDLVWDANTKPELLDQWWAPKPWASRTKVMEFREGGRRFYAMVSPEGAERWAIQEYKSITDRNIAFLEAVLAEDYIYTGANGRGTDRAGVLAFYRRTKEKPKSRTVSLVHDNIKARVVGDMAVVTNDYMSKTVPIDAPDSEPPNDSRTSYGGL